MKIKLKAYDAAGISYLKDCVGHDIKIGDIVELDVKLSSVKVSHNSYWLGVDDGSGITVVDDYSTQTKPLTLTETVAHLKELIG